MNEIIDDEFDIGFVDKRDELKLNNLVFAANYLGIIPLFELLCVQIAISHRGTSKHALSDNCGSQAAQWILKSTSDHWWL